MSVLIPVQTKTGCFRYKYGIRFGFRAVLFLGIISVFALYNNFIDSPSTSSSLLPGVVDGALADGRRRLEDSTGSNGIFQPIADPTWLVIFYIIGILYTFLALAIVCDEYFVPALEEMTGENQLNMSLDVAGATLMAAGGSSPELFTSFFGTFQESSIGFGAIVGSAVFNVLFVIGVCAVLSKDVLVLSKWPLARDCLYYAISLVILGLFVGLITPGVVELWEALILFVMYFGYVAVMALNKKLYKIITGEELHPPDEEGHSNEAFISFKYPTTFRAGLLTLIREPESWLDKARIGLVSKIAGNVDEVFAQLDKDSSGSVSKEELRICFSKVDENEMTDQELDKIMEDLDKNKSGTVSKSEFKTWYLNSEEHIRGQIRKVFDKYDENSSGTISVEEFRKFTSEVIPLIDNTEENEIGLKQLFKDEDNGSEVKFDDFVAWYFSSTYYEGEQKKVIKEEKSETILEIISPPKDAGLFGYLKWLLLLPLVATFALTIPDVRRNNVPGKLCYLAFSIAIIWIGFYSYFMVGWAETVGATVGIPTYIMGLTFIAAGTSVPDLISSTIVARMGEGDMAVSSSIGSNIFDILVGLPLPWLAFIIYPNDKSTVSIGAQDVWLSIMILVGMLALIVITIHLSKWTLTKKLGYTMFIFYFGFLLFSIVKEYA